MNFRETTNRIINLVEEQTGFPVRVTKDESLKTLATVRMARDPMPVHLIVYNPSIGTAPDYLICYQCGFILRLFDCPPSERYGFAMDNNGRKIVKKLLTSESGVASKLSLPKEIVTQLCSQFYDGIMLQLRSVPIGLRVDSWLRHDYPELKDLQEASAKKQLQDNTQVLNPKIKKITPSKIFRANMVMNAAFAQFWSQILNEPHFTLPYKATKYWYVGLKLMEIWKDIPDKPEDDYELINTWAEELGLSGWYQWTSYENKNERK